MKYVNIHGQPVTVDVKAMVLALRPRAAAHACKGTERYPSGCYIIVDEQRGNPWGDNETLGSAGTEDAAWIEALHELERQALAHDPEDEDTEHYDHGVR